MGPPVGRARSPPGLGPHNCRGPGDTLPQKRPEARPRSFGRPVNGLQHHQPTSLDHRGWRPQDRQGLAVAAGHRPLTRTREQEPMGRPRRTRTREPPGGAQPSPAQGSWPGSSRRETRELEDGRMARTRAHPPRRLAMSRASRSSSKLIVRPAPPLPPEEGFSPGVCLRQPGLLGRRTPVHSPPQSSSRGGANVDSRAPLLSSLARRALYPSHPPLPSQDGFRGLWAARLSGKPAASHRQ